MNKEVSKIIKDIFVRQKGFATTEDLTREGVSKYYIRKFEQNEEIIRINRAVVYFTEPDKKSGSFFRKLYKDYEGYFYQYIYGSNEYI